MARFGQLSVLALECQSPGSFAMWRSLGLLAEITTTNRPGAKLSFAAAIFAHADDTAEGGPVSSDDGAKVRHSLCNMPEPNRPVNTYLVGEIVFVDAFQIYEMDWSMSGESILSSDELMALVLAICGGEPQIYDEYSAAPLGIPLHIRNATKSGADIVRVDGDGEMLWMVRFTVELWSAGSRAPTANKRYLAHKTSEAWSALWGSENDYLKEASLLRMWIPTES